MDNKIELNKYILDSVDELERYYCNGDLADLESGQWLREVRLINQRIANELMHIRRAHIARKEVIEVLNNV